MPHTRIFADLSRLRRVAHAAEGLGVSRRGFLAGAAAVASLAAAPAADVSVGIVGAGLAGLACADELLRGGIRASVYEASARAGGRCFSLKGFFPGQVAERGGEFIDTGHKTMIGYAKRFGLTLEDVEKAPGEVAYHFGGVRYPEAVVVDEYRAFVATMRADLRASSGAPTARSHNAADVRLDRTSLLAYLEGENATGRAAGPVAKAAIIAAYEAEYGLNVERQSALNFLLFIHADKRGKFRPFGVWSDERYHVVEGNDRIAAGLAAGADISTGLKLVAARAAGGRIELEFKRGGQSVVKVHDAVVLTLPFTALREVQLDPSLAIPADQRNAIATLGYGTNAKMMIGFSARPWASLGSTGGSYSDLPNHQATWETNPAGATAARAVLTDYSSGLRGATLNPAQVQTEAGRFLADLEKVYPGAQAAATRVSGKFVAHLEHWPSNPLTRGSYTCYTPGQFTTVAGLEGLPAGNLHFAGEHADSFYSWQGFMEGACLSGLRAAAEIFADLKAGRLG
ncbi:MAG TPA: FAD-dependent oxidoreductase [Planctomycetota bacterium]